MASRGSSTRSAARATSSAPRRLRAELGRRYRSAPIRWRLAGGSALLTLIILGLFAGMVMVLAGRQITRDFEEQTSEAASRLAKVDLSNDIVPVGVNSFDTGSYQCPGLSQAAAAEGAVVRVLQRLPDGRLAPYCPPGANKLLDSATGRGTIQRGGYRIETRRMLIPAVFGGSYGLLQYARPLSIPQHTIGRVRLFLLFGVLGGAALALLAGLATARRAIAPVSELTAAAREVERTRDPSRRLPHPEAEDEVAELARTLQQMLDTLDAARTDTEAALERQRTFVADASHELRTPLTSVLAHLELLAAELDGEQRDSAIQALRSTNRMRRLVGDLLLLARADARRRAPRRAIDLARVLIDAAGELGPLAEGHELVLAPHSATVDGVPDELHRAVRNLMENALRHTPPGTRVSAAVELRGEDVAVVVEDEGPGVPPELREHIFDRFVRAAGDAGAGSGLGLAIVRSVAESHGGQALLLERAIGHGARFELVLPAAPARAVEDVGTVVEAEVARPPRRPAAPSGGA